MTQRPYPPAPPSGPSTLKSKSAAAALSHPKASAPLARANPKIITGRDRELDTSLCYNNLGHQYRSGMIFCRVKNMHLPAIVLALIFSHSGASPQDTLATTVLETSCVPTALVMLTWSAPTGHVVRQGNGSDSNLPPRAQTLPFDVSPSSLEHGPGSLPDIYDSVDVLPILVSCGLR